VYPNVGLTSARAAFARRPSWRRGCCMKATGDGAGEAFGTSEHIRISYPVTKQNIDEGTKRMGEIPDRTEITQYRRKQVCLPPISHETPPSPPRVFYCTMCDWSLCKGV